MAWVSSEALEWRIFLVVLIKDVPNQHMLSQVINIKNRLEAEV